MGSNFYLYHIRSCASSAPGSSHGSSFCSAQPFSGDGDPNSGGFISGLANTSAVTPAVTSGVDSVPDVFFNSGVIDVGVANTSAGTPDTASIHPLCTALHDVGGGVHADLATVPFLLLAVLVRLPCETTSGCSCDAS